MQTKMVRIVLSGLFAVLTFITLGANNVALAACPPAPGGWPTDTVERAEFCVYYDSADTTLAQATQFANDLDEQIGVNTVYGWPLPVPDAGQTKHQALLQDNGLSCNGSVSPGTDELNVWEGCGVGTIFGREVAGHEGDHLGVQLRGTVNNFDGLFMHEGMARSGQDKKLADSDHDPAWNTYPFGYETEVNNYLANTNRDLTSNPMRYESAFFWTYLAEQCGTFPNNDLGRGWGNFNLNVWDAATTSNSIAAVNNALAGFGCPSFDQMFQKFAVTVFAKNLAGTPADLTILDELEAGNVFNGTLVTTGGGTINTVTSATFNNQTIAKYGVKHFVTQPAANCVVPVVDFHNDNPGTPAFYDVVPVLSGNTFGGRFHGTGTDFSVAFLNGTGANQIVDLMGSVGSSGSSSPSVDVSFSCASPVLDLLQSTQLSPDHVQPGDLTVVLVRVTDGTITGPVVGGLSNTDFNVEIDGTPALIVGGGFTGEIYALLVQVPNKANGPYTLAVELEEPGTSTVIASDSELEAIVYDLIRIDNVLIADRSGSMLGDKLDAAKAALHFFKDASNNTEGLAAAAYNHNLSPVPVVDMAFGTLVQKTAVGNYIDSLTATGGTSIGDGLAEGAAQCNGSPTGNSECLMILASDGLENSSLFYADVMTDVVNAGKVLALSIGPSANETLMQQIATDTGGAAYYVDTNTSSLRSTDVTNAVSAYTIDDMALTLGRTYLTMYGQGARTQEFLYEQGTMPTNGSVQTHTVHIDPFTSKALFALDWNQRGIETFFFLQKPDGTPITPPYSFEDFFPSMHLGYWIDQPDPGEWLLIVGHQGGAKDPVPYSVLVSGNSQVEAFFLPVFGGRLETGEQIHLCGLFPLQVGQARFAASDVSMSAAVRAPSGATSQVQFYDDGQHGDGHPADGLACGDYTLGNQANVVQPPPEDNNKDPEAPDEGSYQIDLNIVEMNLTRRILSSFTLSEGTDTNGDNIPDSWTERYGPANEDPDLDLLNTGDEYFVGTNPLLSDTDFGGENDGSEVRKGSDPLDAADDQIAAPEHFLAHPQDGGNVQLVLDVKPDYTQAVIHRATNPNGPFNLVHQGAVPSGMYIDETAVPGVTYFYRYQAINANDHWSQVLDNQGLSAEDATPPEAGVLINDGAMTTMVLSVSLSFVPNLESEAAFNDIVQVKVANTVSGLDTAPWQNFVQEIPHTLANGESGMRTIYVQLRDDDGNVSVGITTAAINYQPSGGTISLFLPILAK